jgi:hypothetical protein
VRKIGFGFVDTSNRVFLGRRARAETFDLGKNEPHPMGFLLAGLQFVPDLAVDGVLRVDEALQVVGVGGHWCVDGLCVEIIVEDTDFEEA